MVLRTKPSGLYRHPRGLGLHRVGYKGGDLHIRIAKLAFHAKESPIRTQDGVLSLVSSCSNSPDEVYSPAVRIPPNPGIPQRSPIPLDRSPEKRGSHTQAEGDDARFRSASHWHCRWFPLPPLAASATGGRRNTPCNAEDNLRAGLIVIEAWFRGY